MRTPVDQSLRDEASRYRLRFTCGDCANYDPARRACVFEYPVEPHERVDLEQVTHLYFCKSFELW
jgi:hypothetical protein